jgi:hypothetical protein
MKRCMQPTLEIILQQPTLEIILQHIHGCTDALQRWPCMLSQMPEVIGFFIPLEVGVSADTVSQIAMSCVKRAKANASGWCTVPAVQGGRDCAPAIVGIVRAVLLTKRSPELQICNRVSCIPPSFENNTRDSTQLHGCDTIHTFATWAQIWSIWAFPLCDTSASIISAAANIH